MELPLLKRELLELAQRRRTYGLRCLVWLVFGIVFLVAWLNVTRHSAGMQQVLGRGNDISTALFVTLMMTIYALNPAMACSAMTSEKEKQTLGLMILSRLTPGGIVAEKISSRMLPLLSLLLVSTPMFAVAYLFGGVTFTDTLTCLCILLCTILQVTTVAVFCSALLETGFAAFWATYVVLLGIYFALPIMEEFGLIRIDFGGMPDQELLLFPGYLMALVVDIKTDNGVVMLMMTPTLIITGAFAMAARFAVAKYSFGGAFSFVRQIERARRRLIVRLRERRRNAPGIDVSADQDLRSVSDLHTDLLSEKALAANRPVAWRQIHGSVWGRRKIQVGVILGLFFGHLFCLMVWHRDTEEVSAFFSLGGLIVAVLLVTGLSCRLFAMERERQTLDTLLTAPLTNRELLLQKLDGVNRLILLLLVPVLLYAILSLLAADVRWYSGEPVRRLWRTVRPGTPEWFQVAGHFLPCAVGCAVVNLHLAKWIAVYWGLKLNTQMKALQASIVCLLVLGFVPMLLTAAGMEVLNTNPDRFPLFVFSSPMLVPTLNQFHELYFIFRNSWFPKSEILIILINLVLYGSLLLVVRAFVLSRVSGLLQRPETPVTASSHDEWSHIGSNMG